MATTRRITREDVVQLGRSRQPWSFLPVCWQVLRMAPGDQEMMLLGAANALQLGLKAIARWHLDRLEASGRAVRVDGDMAREIAALRTACGGGGEYGPGALPEERLSLDMVAGTASRNLQALEGTAAEALARANFDRWLHEAKRDSWYRTVDGNVVRHRGQLEELGEGIGPGELEWVSFGDQCGGAARFAAQHLLGPIPGIGANAGSAGLPTTYTVEGISPPWLLMQVAACTPAQSDGFWPRINLVQGDVLEFLDGLACADLREVLSQERLKVYLGPEAGRELESDLRGRLALQLSGPYIPLVTLRAPVQWQSGGIAQMLHAIQQEQVEEHHRLMHEVRETAATQQQGRWPVAGRPRVLVCTTRYSTYLQYSSADLVEALRSMGLEAELLIEPDCSSRFATVGYLQMMRTFRPDLVVLINHFRDSLRECIPPEVPFVCWIQDAMPHHFVPGAGLKQGKRDFVAGHLHPEMFTRGGFDRSRAVAFPVVVSTAKFHSGAVDRALRDRYACEIAFVSHHSESPERMHERLLTEARHSAGMAAGQDVIRVLELLRERVMAIGEDAMGERLLADESARDQQVRLRRAVADVISTQAGRAAREDEITPIFRQYALPLAERVLRHQTVRWAAEVCRARGWRFGLYGRGWAGVEELADFARGEAMHGEELRAIYQCASVQLHVSISALVHQRIMECALSGGLPVCRLVRSEVETIASAARRCGMMASPPAACELGTERLGWRIADDGGLMAMMALMQRLGAGEIKGEGGGMFWSRPLRPEQKEACNLLGLERRADWVFGDLSQVAFASPAGLESIVSRAIEDEQWSGAMSAMIAGRVRERLTHEAFMSKVLAMVQHTMQEV